MTPRVCSSAMSATRPSRKPTVAPATGPASNPIERATSGSRSALASKRLICPTTASWSTTTVRTRTSSRTTVATLTFTASPARSRRRPSRRVRTSTTSSSRRSANGRRCTRWYSSRSSESTRVTRPIGIPRGNSDSSRDERQPDVTTVAPLRTARPFCTKSSSRSDGFPTVAFTSPLGPSGTSCADTPRRVIGDQRHARRATGHVRHAADEPGAADDRLVRAHAGARALVDRDRRVPHGRGAADHPRAHRVIAVREAAGAVQPDQRAELARVALGRLQRRDLAPQLPRSACAGRRSRTWRRTRRRSTRRGRGRASGRGWRPPGAARAPRGSHAGSRAGHPRPTRRSKR